MVQSRPGGGNACQQITSDGDDTLNAWRVPSLEKDEETASRRPRTREQGEDDDEEEEENPEAETEPLLIHDDDLESVVIEMAQHER